MSENAEDTLQQIWSSMLSTSLKQTLILSYLNKKFPGATIEMANEFSVISNMLNMPGDVRDEITKTFDGLPQTNAPNSPFSVIANEIMTGTIIQTLMLRYFMRDNPNMVQSMLDDCDLIFSQLDLSELVKERVIALLSEFMPG